MAPGSLGFQIRMIIDLWAACPGVAVSRSRQGRRCTKRHDLEFHHKEPYGRGGDHSAETVCLMCRPHNTVMAEGDYGKEVMKRLRRSASHVCEPMAVYGTGSPPHVAKPRGAARKRVRSLKVRAPAPTP